MTVEDYCRLAAVYASMGDDRAAENILRRALSRFGEHRGAPGMATIYHGLGMIRHLAGDLDTAEEMYLRATRLHEKTDAIHELAVTHANLGTVYRRQGNRAKARQAYRKAADLYDRAGHADGARNVREMLRVPESKT